jgi:hypothetical protein
MFQLHLYKHAHVVCHSDLALSLCPGSFKHDVLPCMYVNSSSVDWWICIYGMHVDIIDCYNYGEIHFKENRSFIFYGLILMGTWIIRTNYYTFDLIL